MCYALCRVLYVGNFIKPSVQLFVEIENGGVLRLTYQVQSQATRLKRTMFLITMLSCLWQRCLWEVDLSKFTCSLPTKSSQIINSSSISCHPSKGTPRAPITSSWGDQSAFSLLSAFQECNGHVRQALQSRSERHLEVPFKENTSPLCQEDYTA